MAAFDYAGLVTELVTILRDDPEMAEADIDVASEPEPPTMDHGSAVRVGFLGFERSYRRIVALNPAASPADEVIGLSLACWAFSGQSADDAARQRDVVVRTAIAAMYRNPTLNGRVQWVEVASGQAEQGGEGGGIHSKLAILLRAHVQT